MPWTEILGGATGGVAAIVVAALFLGKLISEKMADTAAKLVEARLKRAEELQKATLAFAGVVDTDLRTRRIPVYAELWEKTGLLPMWPWNTELEYKALNELTHDLRDWYFKRGGMYLSTSARDAYFEVQKCINVLLEAGKAGRIAHEDYKTVREACSALRTELAEDILSRREAPSVNANTDA
jgi:hypothetical protein